MCVKKDLEILLSYLSSKKKKKKKTCWHLDTLRKYLCSLILEIDPANFDVYFMLFLTFIKKVGT